MTDECIQIMGGRGFMKVQTLLCRGGCRARRREKGCFFFPARGEPRRGRKSWPGLPHLLQMGGVKQLGLVLAG